MFDITGCSYYNKIMKNIDYEKILKEQGSYRKAAKALGITKAKFTTLYKKTLGLCTATTSCNNTPEPGKTRCKYHLKYAIETRDPVKRKEYTKKWKEENKEYIRKKAKEHYYANHEKRREYANKYYRENYKNYNREKSARRRALKLEATPPWVSTKELRKIYAKCPKGYHVDHIIPLVHPKVCGLHVPANLQYLPSKINDSKANKFDGTYDNTSWMDSFSHQYKRRLQTINEDIKLGHNFNLKASDFKYQIEEFSEEIKNFIKKYEWLGTVGWTPQWVFTARYNSKLAGVNLFSTPTMPVKNIPIEQQALIQRGAAASWAPKNLNSKLLMFGCRWLSKNTSKRVFFGYSDPEAGEIGYIYQACNFLYLGKTFGSSKKYILTDGREVSSRFFTRTSSMKNWAKALNIPWESSWTNSKGFQNTKAIPPDILKRLKNYAFLQKNNAIQKKVAKKGKYALILGTKKEIKALLEKIGKTYPYPKTTTKLL